MGEVQTYVFISAVETVISYVILPLDARSKVECAGGEAQLAELDTGAQVKSRTAVLTKKMVTGECAEIESHVQFAPAVVSQGTGRVDEVVRIEGELIYIVIRSKFQQTALTGDAIEPAQIFDPSSQLKALSNFKNKTQAQFVVGVHIEFGTKTDRLADELGIALPD